MELRPGRRPPLRGPAGGCRMSADLSNLTVGEFLHALRQLVAEKGASYVYPESEKRSDGACSYWHNGQPSCIIGHALDALGSVVPPFCEGKNAFTVLHDLGASAQVRWAAQKAQRAED